MEFKKLAESLALLFAVLFVSYLVFSRGKTLVDVYNAESAAYTEDLVENDKCAADHDYLHRAPMKCISARLAVQRWWRWHAVHRVYETTYLCVDQPCGDLMRGAFDSWTSLAVLTAFLVVVFLVMFGGVFRRLDRGENALGGGVGWENHTRPMAYPTVHTHPYGGGGDDNGPTIMYGYDAPPTVGVRQRLTAWIPGSNGGGRVSALT